jgi:hypothetical protein
MTNNYAVLCDKHLQKGNIIPVHAMKAYRVIRIIAPFFIKQRIIWRAFSVSRCIYFVPGNRAFSNKQTNRRLDGPHNHAGCFGEQRDFLCLRLIEL